MNDHTKGPWSVSDTSIVSGKHCIAVIEDDGGYEAPAEERAANARLIAAAPDLLEALESIMKAPSWNANRTDVRRAVAALKKAKVEAKDKKD